MSAAATTNAAGLEPAVSPHGEGHGRRLTAAFEALEAFPALAESRDRVLRVVREDPTKKGLLYAGTETGAWVSFDDGAHWQSLRCGLPTVPVSDLLVKGDDVVISTQGRAFWVLDDVSPLRRIAARDVASDVWLTAPSTVVRMAGGGFPRRDAGTSW